MIIDRHLNPWVVFSDEPILASLQKINANKARVVFCVSEHGHLQGALSDGDFRRWVTSTPVVDLATPSIQVANRQPVTARDGGDADEVGRLFQTGRIEHVAVVDERGHLVGVASASARQLRIGEHVIGEGHASFVIAEIGNNHNGSLELAQRLVDLAADAGADCVKFQMRDMKALYRTADGSSAGEDLGPQYTMNLLTKFSLTNDELFAAFDYARRRGIEVMCTPWDRPSVDALAAYGLPAFKIASADLTNHDLLSYALATSTPLVLSTGMSTEAEIIEAAGLVRRTGTPFAMLHCQSTYPAPFKDVNLAYMDRLAEIADCPVGYSGHERGFHVPVAAVARGARVIEKHFTVDKAMEGNDHKVSLLPDEFAEMVRRIREIEESLGSDAPRAVSTGEMMNRINLAKSLVATRRIEAGEVLTEADVDIKSPGRGLQPNARPQLVGRTMRRPIDAGDFFYATDLSDRVARGRDFTFRRPWGLPVRYHDWKNLVVDATPDFLEFHFSFKDVELDPSTFFTERLPYTFTVHTPDLYAGDFIIDLASHDEAIFERSVRELQRVVDITRDLRQWFTSDLDPVVIATLGGFSANAHVDATERERRYANVERGLNRLDTEGVRFTAQTLPPFPWLFGGQQYHNLFMDPRDTQAFAERTGTRLTLDISHTKLAATFLGMPFSEAVERLAPLTDHLHLVDATGVDGEGVQVGEGEVDWGMLARQLDHLAPSASFIPEIWQGHVNNGEGFWTALERLEAWF